MYFKKEITTRAQIRNNHFESSDCEKIVCHFYQIKDFIWKSDNLGDCIFTIHTMRYLVQFFFFSFCQLLFQWINDSHLFVQ